MVHVHTEKVHWYIIVVYSVISNWPPCRVKHWILWCFHELISQCIKRDLKIIWTYGSILQDGEPLVQFDDEYFTLDTVKAPNFPPSGNFPLFLEDPQLLHVNSVIKINKTNTADLSNFSNFYSPQFSVEHILMLANSFERKVESFQEMES